MKIPASTTTLLILAVSLGLHPGPVSSSQQLETPQTHQPSTVAIPLIRARRRGLARRSTLITPEEAAEKAREAAAAAIAREAAERAREAAERAREAIEKARAEAEGTAGGAGQGNESTGGDESAGDSGNAGGSD